MCSLIAYLSGPVVYFGFMSSMSAITADKYNIICSFALTFGLALALDYQNALMMCTGCDQASFIKMAS